MVSVIRFDIGLAGCGMRDVGCGVWDVGCGMWSESKLELDAG